MPNNRLLQTITLRNFLSYGSEGVEIPLEPLNVLIGPNASGKSNLIEALDVLRYAPQDIAVPIRQGGGVSDWLWNGETSPHAEIQVTVSYPQGIVPLRYKLTFAAVNQRFTIVDEAVENERPTTGQARDVYFFYRFQDGAPVINARTKEDAPAGTITGRKRRLLHSENFSPDQSVLQQRKDPDQYPEITYLSNHFARMMLYRDWNLGRYTPPRLPQKADLPEDVLLEDASNLGLVLNSLQNQPRVKRQLIGYMQRFYYSVEDIITKVHGGTVQVYLHEEGLQHPVPATRLSDGTLRFLCLLAILCNPDPPPVICIEEPELGLHPDIMPTIAELLVEASHRTQVIVTTHSDALVSALSDSPQAVIVAERDAGGTTLKRLEPRQLAKWLEAYSLGELWRMGEIGGTKKW